MSSAAQSPSEQKCEFPPPRNIWPPRLPTTKSGAESSAKKTSEVARPLLRRGEGVRNFPLGPPPGMKRVADLRRGEFNSSANTEPGEATLLENPSAVEYGEFTVRFEGLSPASPKTQERIEILNRIAEEMQGLRAPSSPAIRPEPVLPLDCSLEEKGNAPVSSTFEAERNPLPLKPLPEGKIHHLCWCEVL